LRKRLSDSKPVLVAGATWLSDDFGWFVERFDQTEV